MTIKPVGQIGKITQGSKWQNVDVRWSRSVTAGDFLYGPEAMAEIERLRHALSQIVDRSHNGELGTAKVIDMRRIAERGLAGEDSSMTDEHLWHFWNEKARALAAENAALRQQLVRARNKALYDAAHVGYVSCAETRHVTLGDKVRSAILAMKDSVP
ncbi:MAG: hypothetical protein DI589_11180 [Shinella sp.]|nr:MAG: hypothetical protein DI589_11180 [Shinella sp.]